MVAPEQRVPVQCALPCGGQRLELFQRKGDHVPFSVLAVDVHDVKLEQQVQFSPVPDDTVRIIQSDAGRFSHAHAIPTVKAAFAHLAQMGMQRRLEGRMLARESVAGAAGVGQAGCFGDQADHIHAEPVHALVEPPVDHGVDFFPKLRIFPVEVRLLLPEKMQIPLLCRRIIAPCRRREEG